MFRFGGFTFRGVVIVCVNEKYGPQHEQTRTLNEKHEPQSGKTTNPQTRNKDPNNKNTKTHEWNETGAEKEIIGEGSIKECMDTNINKKKHFKTTHQYA